MPAAHRSLVAHTPAAHKRRAMPEPLFDMRLRALRRDRAARIGPVQFVHERLFEDCLERISSIGRRFRSTLLIGCPDPTWPKRLEQLADVSAIFDPGPLFAKFAGGEPIIEDAASFAPRAYDLCLAIGTLDTVNDVPGALRGIRDGLAPGALFIGAVPGGDTLPQLRLAMRAADSVTGAATPHIHPRIEAAALATLLSSAGFVQPVVDVDRMRVSYSSLASLVADLRAMGATNILKARSKVALSRAGMTVAADSFTSAGNGERTVELFEILHFAGWVPQQG